MKRTAWTEQGAIDAIHAVGKATFIGWVGGFRKSASRALCSCHCGNQWEASLMNLTKKASGCRKCGFAESSAKQQKPEADYLQDLSEVAKGRFEVLGRVGPFAGKNTRVRLRCLDDGWVWTASFDKLINDGTGCPECGQTRQLTEQEVVAKIGPDFTGWVSGFKNQRSRAKLTCCTCSHEWESTAENVINYTGCPACANHGYNPGKPGSLYALMSECGSMVKIGISNNVKTRHQNLRAATPFKWDQIAQIDSQDGAQIARFEKELHALTTPVTFPEKFDGYTEWRAFTPDIMDHLTRLSVEVA